MYKVTALKLKDKGDAALSANNIEEAVDTIKEADKAVELKLDWTRAYSRKRTFLAYLNLSEVRVQKASKSRSFPKLFVGADALIKLINHPRTRAYLDDPEYLVLLAQLQLNYAKPPLMGTKFQDPRVSRTLLVLMGIDPGTDEPMDTEPTYSPPPKKTKPNPEPKKEPEPDLPENKKLAKLEKVEGNSFYKKKDFPNAILHYSKAIEHDPTDITFYNNLAAVYFEQKGYEKCVKECEKGIEIGGENRADFKLIAKSFMILGNAYKKMKDYKTAKMCYEKSMSDHRTPEIKTLLSAVEKIIKEEERKSSVNPELAEKEKEIGNEFFKKDDYASAVKHYNEAVKRNPHDAKLYRNRAACCTKLAAFDLALKDCEKRVELDPKCIKGWIRKGHILQRMQNSSQAIVAFQKALEIDPINAKALAGYRACSIENANLDGVPGKIRQRAMGDPEVQAILRDPAMRMTLEQMQNDNRALQDLILNNY